MAAPSPCPHPRGRGRGASLHFSARLVTLKALFSRADEVDDFVQVVVDITLDKPDCASRAARPWPPPAPPSRSPRRPSGRVTALVPVVASPRARSSIRPRTTPPAPPRRPRRRNPPTLPHPTLPPTARTWRRTMRFASARWWASSSNGAWERGASGSGLSVRLPDGSGRGRGLEASRDIAEGEPGPPLPLEMGICDYQDGHPPDSWETMSNAPWGVRLACRLPPGTLQVRRLEWAPYLAPPPRTLRARLPLLWTHRRGAAPCIPPRRRRGSRRRDAVKTWHAKLEAACPSASPARTSTRSPPPCRWCIRARTASPAPAARGTFLRALLSPRRRRLNHAGDEYDAAFSKWPPARRG